MDDVYTISPIDMVECDFSKHFARADNKERFENTKATCLQSNEGYFKGSIGNADSSEELFVFLSKCYQSGCKSNEEIEAYLSQMSFSILKADNYVKYDDIDNPLHTHISQSQIGSFGS